MTHWNKVNFSLTADLTQPTPPCPNLPQRVHTNHVYLQVEIRQKSLTCPSQLDGQSDVDSRRRNVPQREPWSKKPPSWAGGAQRSPPPICESTAGSSFFMVFENWERLRWLFENRVWSSQQHFFLLIFLVGGNNPSLHLSFDKNVPKTCELLETVPNSPKCLLSTAA